MDDPVTTYEWAQLITAIASVLIALVGAAIAATVAVLPWRRRPKLRVVKDLDRNHSHVEQSQLGGLPHVRLVVENGKKQRAAHNTRVFVEGYWVREAHAAAPETLGHPSLLWPSASDKPTDAATVYGGQERPITLGVFFRVKRDPTGVLQYVPEHKYPQVGADAWYMTLAIELDINDNREKLEPVDGGYLIDLLVGADEGQARSVKVRIDWNGDPDQSPAQVLASALDHLSVE